MAAKARSSSRLAASNWPLRTRLILVSLSLSAVAILASDFASNSALRSFLINQVDTQLNSIAGGSILRLDRAGIDPNSTEEDSTNTGLKPVRPLGGVPTATRWLSWAVATVRRLHKKSTVLECVTSPSAVLRFAQNIFASPITQLFR